MGQNISFIQKQNGYYKMKEEWFRIWLTNGKKYTLHRSVYKFKMVGQQLFPYLELETAVKKSKYLIRQWRHRRRR